MGGSAFASALARRVKHHRERSAGPPSMESGCRPPGAPFTAFCRSGVPYFAAMAALDAACFWLEPASVLAIRSREWLPGPVVVPDERTTRGGFARLAFDDPYEPRPALLTPPTHLPDPPGTAVAGNDAGRGAAPRPPAMTAHEQPCWVGMTG